MATFPERALAALQAATTRATDLALVPILAVPPLAGLLLVALATALLMLAVARRVSDQRRIVAVKRQIAAALLEIRLFNDDPVAVLRAAGAALGHNVRYLGLSLVPVAWLALPLGLAVAQLQMVYGYDGLRVGEPVLVRVRLAAPLPPDTVVALDVPDGLERTTDAVRLAGGDEVLWQLVPRRAGAYTLHVRVDAQVEGKTLTVGAGVGRRSPVRPGHGLWPQLQWPSERPLPADGRIASIEVRYPEAAIAVAGWELSWLVVDAALTLAAALALAPRLGVTL